MSVAVETVLDVSLMGQQAQDVYSSAPEAFKADVHLAFRSDRLRFVHDWRLLHYVFVLRRSDAQSEPSCLTLRSLKVRVRAPRQSLKQCKMIEVQLIVSSVVQVTRQDLQFVGSGYRPTEAQSPLHLRRCRTIFLPIKGWCRHFTERAHVGDCSE